MGGVDKCYKALSLLLKIEKTPVKLLMVGSSIKIGHPSPRLA